MFFKTSTTPAYPKLAILLMAAFLATAHAAENNQKLMGQLKKIAIDSLKDPDSAKFKEMFIGFPEDSESSARSLCGYVNAKNSMGGYTGFTRFIVSTEGLISLDPKESMYLWPVWCNRHKTLSSGSDTPKSGQANGFPPAPDFSVEGVVIPSTDWRDQYKPKP